MVEKNEIKYIITQDNKLYNLSTSLIDDKILFVCKDNSQIYEGKFAINDLMKISNYFQPKYNVSQIQMYINNIIEKNTVQIKQTFSMIYLKLILFNKDIINIPLNRKICISNRSYSFLGNYISPEKIRNRKHINSNNISNYQNENYYSNNQNDLINKDLDSNDNKNKEIRKMHSFEEENKNYKIQIEQFDIENKILKEQIKNLNIKNKENDKRIKDLENTLKAKEKELAKKIEQISSLNLKIQQLECTLNDNINKDKIIELMEKLELKEKEIKEIKARYPLELSKGEKLMSVIFQSLDQKFTRSFICKNTDLFTKLESLLYKEYPEYSENEGENYFLVNGRKIYRYKSLEENGIHNSDIIILNKIDN